MGAVFTCFNDDAPGGSPNTEKRPIEIHYFKGVKGRSDPLEQMCTFHGKPWTRIDHEFGNGPVCEFGKALPQVTINGKVMMGQTGAVLRSMGTTFGYYDPTDWKTAAYCDPIVETWGDVIGALGAVAFAKDDESKKAAKEKLLEICCKFSSMIEKGMALHNGKFAAGEKMTIADFVL